MSTLAVLTNGWLISHAHFIKNVYAETFRNESSAFERARYCSELFQIYRPYKTEHNLKNESDQAQVYTYHSNSSKDQVVNITNTHRRKRKKKLLNDTTVSEHGFLSQLNEVKYVQNFYNTHLVECKKHGQFTDIPITPQEETNDEARSKSDSFYQESSKHVKTNFHGANNTDMSVISSNESEQYIFPPHCEFFCYDVRDIQSKINLLQNYYDLILLDPPWWNKYIRRKKTKRIEAAYQMMYNEEIALIPIPSLLTPGSLVAVWCTNSESHLNSLKLQIFPAWGVQYIGIWYWLKVTHQGELICPFTKPPGKQPYEKIVFGYCPGGQKRSFPLPEDGKMVLSVPSAIHSHKPPLSEILAPYLPPDPKCLELFARYLLPGWTSWGNEVLKLQHLSLFKTDTTCENI